MSSHDAKGAAPRSFFLILIILALGTFALLLPSPVAAAEAPKGEPIKIGWIAELSGTWSFFGATGLTAAQIAEEEINAKGGVLGRPLQVIPMDNRTDPAQAASAARMLDTQQKVLVLSGPTSSDTSLAIYGYAEQNQVPFVVPVAAFPRLTRPGTQWTFRVEPDAVGWGYAIVKFVEKMKPGASIALIYSDFALQRAIVAGIKYQAERSGIKIATRHYIPAKCHRCHGAGGPGQVPQPRLRHGLRRGRLRRDDHQSAPGPGDQARTDHPPVRRREDDPRVGPAQRGVLLRDLL